MATISEVAARAGVGVGTVSRVLNESAQVSPTTRHRVLAAIEELHYRPSAAARALSTGRTGVIGVLAPFFTSLSTAERLQGVVEVLDGSPFELLLFNVASPEQREDGLQVLARHDRVDGLIVLSLPLRVGEGERHGPGRLPTVLVDVDQRAFPGLWTDDVHGGARAARHLLELGHRRTTLIGH